MNEGPIRIGMWTGPRNISTTMMRAFENRPDTAVEDEPFYAYYLKESGVDHPMRAEVLASQPQRFADVVAGLNGPAPGGAAVYFHKHISYHCAPNGDLSGVEFGWIDRHRSFLLIRDPRAMVASYAQKFAEVGPIVRSLEVQTRILEHCRTRGAPCPIVDAEDILRAPRLSLTVLCAALDIPFLDAMLSWPAGRRDSDGVWAPHWYDAVEKSTGFKPYEARPLTLSDELESVAASCMPAYRALHAQRLALA